MWNYHFERCKLTPSQEVTTVKCCAYTDASEINNLLMSDRVIYQYLMQYLRLESKFFPSNAVLLHYCMGTLIQSQRTEYFLQHKVKLVLPQFKNTHTNHMRN